MRGSRSAWKVIAILAGGAVLGTLAGQLLAHQVPVLARQTAISWNPRADLGVLKFNLAITLRVNWLTLVGIVAAWFVSRKA